MSAERYKTLQKQLHDGGFAIAMLSFLPPQAIKIFHFPEATQAQKDAALTFVAAFDWREREPRPQAELMTDVAALNPAQRNKLLEAIAADYLQRFPDFAEKIGIPIKGDKLKP